MVYVMAYNPDFHSREYYLTWKGILGVINSDELKPKYIKP
jgi:hypothetical protein